MTDGAYQGRIESFTDRNRFGESDHFIAGHLPPSNLSVYTVKAVHQVLPPLIVQGFGDAAIFLRFPIQARTIAECANVHSSLCFAGGNDCEKIH
jgi:hypothetical protein